MTAIVSQTGEPDLPPTMTVVLTKTPTQIIAIGSTKSFIATPVPIKEQTMSTQELINRYQAGERDFKKIKLTRVDLSGIDLSVADLTGADLSEANLSGANLSGTILKGSNLSGADLSGADLSWADLGMANLTGANLREANMNMSILIRTRFKNTIMPDGSKR